MNSGKVIYNPIDLRPDKEFIDAKTLISSSKSWKKWSKTVSKALYEQICEDIMNAASAMGLNSVEVADFIRNVIDYYIDNGTLKPRHCQFGWEMALFAIFKRQIDRSIRRRYKAMLAAQKRRKQKAEDSGSLKERSCEVTVAEKTDSNDATGLVCIAENNMTKADESGKFIKMTNLKSKYEKQKELSSSNKTKFNDRAMTVRDYLRFHS